MKPFIQLLRQPIRTALALILLTASASFICLSWGVYRSVNATGVNIDNSFVTLAELRAQIAISESYELNPETQEYEEITYLYDMSPDKEIEKIGKFSDFSDLLNSSPALRGFFYHVGISAYSDSLIPVTSVSVPERYNSLYDNPYNNGVFVIKVNEVELYNTRDRTYNSVSSADPPTIETVYNYHIYGDIVDYVSFHPSYEKRSKILLYVDQLVEESIFEVGKTYIVGFEGYSDSDLQRRNFILKQLRLYESMGIGGKNPFNSPDEIVWEGHVSYDQKDILRFGRALIIDGEEVYPPAVYILDDGTPIIDLWEDDLADIGYCSADVSQRYMTTPIAEIDCDLEEFLKRPENENWVKLINNLQNANHAVPVIGTDLLESIANFNKKTCYMVEGSDFSPEDYKKGNKVCIISESLAQSSGLSVGDKIPLNFYGSAAALYLETPNDEFFKPFPSEYEIVGIYRNNNQWSGLNSDITPNAIFAPLKSFDDIRLSFVGEEKTVDDLKLLTDKDKLMSIVIKNGCGEDIKSLLRDNGWDENLLIIEDNGYSGISETVAAMSQSSTELLLASSATFLAITAAYIALFVIKQRKNAGLMMSLGAGRIKASVFIIAISSIPAVLASAVGAVIGSLLIKRTVSSIFDGVTKSLSGTFSSTVNTAIMELKDNLTVLPTSIFAACLAIIAIYIVLISAVAVAITRKKPLDLIKK